MKNDRLALMLLACTAAPAFAQGALPQCESANYDKVRGVFTVISPAPNIVNQQCLLTIHPTQASASSAQYPAPFLVEGNYVIELSGGGGAGGSGASRDGGGGGGGAGAAPLRTVQYLSAGVYKLTIGKGGAGGQTGDGGSTSLTNVNTGQLIAGFPGADVWTPRTRTAAAGQGGAAKPGGSSGGSGGDSGPRSEEAAQAGGASQTAGFSGMPGQAGGESGRNAQANAGGGGGAGAGSGGAGESANGNSAAGAGDLGGGGGGGRGGLKTTDSGGRGGDGFIKLALQTAAAPVAQAPAPAVIEREPVAAQAASTEPRVSARPAKRDRN